MFYSTSIFKSIGLDGQWPIYATILLNAVQFVMTLVCLFIIDRAGRRILLIAGMLGMCVFSFLLSISRILAVNHLNLKPRAKKYLTFFLSNIQKNEDREWLNYITLVSAVAYIVFFAIGPGKKCTLTGDIDSFFKHFLK